MAAFCCVHLGGGGGGGGEAHSSFGPSSFMQPPPGHFLLPFPPSAAEKGEKTADATLAEGGGICHCLVDGVPWKGRQMVGGFFKIGFITVLVGEFLSSLVCGDFNTADTSLRATDRTGGGTRYLGQ